MKWSAFRGIGNLDAERPRVPVAGSEVWLDQVHRGLADPKPDNTVPEVLAGSLNVLNAIDTLSTVYLVAFLGVEEWNPITAALINWSPFAFVWIKVFTVGIGSRFLAKQGLVIPLLTANCVYLGAVAAHAVCLFIHGVQP